MIAELIYTRFDHCSILFQRSLPSCRCFLRCGAGHPASRSGPLSYGVLEQNIEEVEMLGSTKTESPCLQFCKKLLIEFHELYNMKLWPVYNMYDIIIYVCAVCSNTASCTLGKLMICLFFPRRKIGNTHNNRWRMLCCVFKNRSIDTVEWKQPRVSS